MLLLSHPTINCAVRHTAHALSRAGVLGEFWTWLRTADRLLLQCVPSSSLLEPQETATAEPLPGGTVPVRPATSPASSLDDAMSERLGSDRFRGVYAYEDGADATFRAAGRQGLLRVYDLPRGWRGPHPILAEEADCEPEWAATLTQPPGAALARTHSELHQADLVLVGSSFGLQTLEEVAGLPATIAIMPPPPPSLHSPAAVVGEAPATSNILRVLFAGRLGQRSGLSYLFSACRKLGPSVALTVIGDIPAVSCPRLEQELQAVRWLPRCSGESLNREMAAHDVFLFPAIFDGSSELLLAAMAMGLPIIGTPHSAAPDLIRDGEDGFIVPIRSTSLIAEKLEILQQDATLRQQMSIRARQRARDYTWERFEQTVAASVAAALGRR